MRHGCQPPCSSKLAKFSAPNLSRQFCMEQNFKLGSHKEVAGSGLSKVGENLDDALVQHSLHNFLQCF